jgi:hypothetical protein
MDVLSPVLNFRIACYQACPLLRAYDHNERGQTRFGGGYDLAAPLGTDVSLGVCGGAIGYSAMSVAPVSRLPSRDVRPS